MNERKMDMNLNTKQLEAVRHKEGPLLIIAGAGSGKTTVLSHRVHYLVEQNVQPNNILCVTFTNKAVNELQSRIVKRTGKEGEKVWVSTFHELSRTILEMFRPEPFSVTHTAESRQIIKKIIDNMQVNDDLKEFVNPSKIMKVISLLKSELITVDLLEKKPVLHHYVDGVKLKEILEEEVDARNKPQHFKALLSIYKAYEQQLHAIGKIDVDDMLLLAVRMLVENPLSLRQYQQQYTYFMVDEYQDTNRAQYTLIKLLASKTRNLVAVGDDFQSIYKFRGSDIRNILAFDKDYPEAVIIKLEENYRSTKIILEAANQIIAHNKEQKEKTLYTAHETGEKIKYHVAKTSLDEAKHIASEIKKLVQEGFNYRDIAIFYRNNAESSHFETVFPTEEIPYLITKESSFFERKEIKDVLSYLQFAFDESNEYAFNQCINMPKRGIGKTSVDRFIEQANGNSLLQVVKNPVGIKLNKNAEAGAKDFIAIITTIQEKEKQMSVSELISFVLGITNYKESYADLETHLKKEKDDYLKRLLSIAQEMEKENPALNMQTFLSDLSKRDMAEELSEGEEFNKVNLLTIHSSKGLEFPVVFAVGMKEGGFPSKFATTTAAIEEERRLCYVAFTRAMKRLYVSYPSTSLEKDEQNPKEKVEVENKPSRFLSEFESNLLETF